MNITEGNIFEAMRLVLPEHRDLMERSERDLRKRVAPMLTEDQYNEIQFVLSECLEEQRPVEVTLFDPYDDDVWRGTPIIRNGKLCLRRGNELWPVPMDRVVKVEAL
ncbi:YolD-like family protein [Alicyclobacillus macrosporangiidus]|uniref:YolD-like family protein n=1 Tax=Alicyclobacillus macrosporangiidus TaxID=392015 RepID=UPI000496BEFC|nr:YolD-like family protein [Alicyclobacillus macrosporangiidus]